MRIKIGLPPDGSFLSTVMYEGLAKLVASSSSANIRNGVLELDDDAFVKAFLDVKEKLPKEVDINGRKVRIGKGLELPTTGKNDKSGVEGIFKGIGMEPPADPNKKLRYEEFLKALAKAAEDNPSTLIPKNDVSLMLSVVKGSLTVGNPSKKPLKFSLFKSIDRYTAYLVSELRGAGPNVGFQMSFWTSLIALLGLYEGYVGRVGDAYVFLFIEPHKITEALYAYIKGLSPKEVVKRYLTARDVGIDRIGEVLPLAFIRHALLARAILDVDLMNALRRTNLDRLDLKVVRLHVEGNTYKVYAEIPLTITAYRNGKFSELLPKLSKHVTADSPIIKCIVKLVQKGTGLKGVKPCDENDEILKAIDNLYRFAALNDAEALYNYVKSLEEAAKILEAQGDPQEMKKVKIYRALAGSLI
ncbi:MAG: hypothetical protein J7L55_00435 [Desulfurococcales archaeon]|nr:hypothetical protein [Desulfurococcales archaeon]